MVKLAQHIEWSSPIPLRTGEGAISLERKKGDQAVANGKPRKTLAELFESRATSSSSASLLSSAPSSSSTTTAATTTTPLSVRTASSVSTSSSASSTTESSAANTTPPPPKAPSSSSSSSSSTPSPLPPSAPVPSSSSTHAHVTFVENRADNYHKHAHITAAHPSSELAGGIKRSSSARKIADSSRHEGALLRSNGIAKRLSKSGPLGRPEPLPRSPLTNASNSEPSHGISPAKPSNRHHGRPNENVPKRSIFGEEKISPSPAATNLSNLEQRNRSPFAKFRIHEHNPNNFLQKSIDTVESLQNLGRFRQKDTDPFVNRRLNIVYGVHSTPAKEKKVRKGLFGLLADSGTAKDLGGESKGADASRRKFSGNLGKAANTHHTGGTGGKVRDSKSPPTGPPVNAITMPMFMDVEMRNDQNLGSRMSGLLGATIVSTSLTVEIPDKMVGLAWVGAEPRLLMPGSHTFPSDKFILEQVVSDRTSYVKHGILHRVHIAEGHLGVAWVDGKAVLLEAGVSVHMCPSNKFSYITTDEKMLSEKEFVLGPFRVVTVDESEVGIKFCNRQPQILYSGRHCLSISKVEVFAGFESLLRRQSYTNEASAMSSDNMKVSADVWVEWQIKAEDAAAARLANVTDVEGALCGKVRRAFNLVIWEVNAHDMKLQLTAGTGSITNSDPQPLLKSLSSNVCRECLDLFEEGWTVTIWDLQLKHFVIQPEVQIADGNDSLDFLP